MLAVVAGVWFVGREFGVRSLSALMLLALPVAVVLGWIFSKLAIEPLVTYFETLERFSKETLHELNIPVSTITTNTQMLRKSCDDERARKRIGRIEAACDLLRMRYDELDYLIKRQMQREVIETVALETVVAERIEALREIYPHHGLEADLEPISLKLDKMGFIKVIDNLIDNAVKHSPTGGTVTVTLRGRELRVRDEGRGMNELEIFRVFDRYYQSDESQPGFGIGLDLVKRYCDRYRIALRIDSAPQKGTTMILDFSGVGET